MFKFFFGSTFSLVDVWIFVVGAALVDNGSYLLALVVYLVGFVFHFVYTSELK